MMLERAVSNDSISTPNSRKGSSSEDQRRRFIHHTKPAAKHKRALLQSPSSSHVFMPTITTIRHLFTPNVHMDAIYIRSLFSGSDRALIGSQPSRRRHCHCSMLYNHVACSVALQPTAQLDARSVALHF